MRRSHDMWIDAHAHLQDQRISSSLLLEWTKNARDQGIAHWILGGVGPEDWKQQLSLREKFPQAFSLSAGLHPWWVAEHTQKECEQGLDQLKVFFESSPGGVVALGELGLDFHPKLLEESHSRQKEMFEAQIDLAVQFKRPLILHVVHAHEQALALLAQKKTQGGIVHSFSGDISFARKYLDLGYVPSLSGAVWSRGEGKAFETLRRTVLSLGPSDFVLETDSPDQPIASEKGSLNPPSQLIQTARWVASVRGEAVETILDRSTKRVREIFNGIQFDPQS